MTTEPEDKDEVPPASASSLPIALVAACFALGLVFLVAPIRDRMILAGAFLLVGAIAAVIIPTWYRRRP